MVSQESAKISKHILMVKKNIVVIPVVVLNANNMLFQWIKWELQPLAFVKKNIVPKMG